MVAAEAQRAEAARLSQEAATAQDSKDMLFRNGIAKNMQEFQSKMLSMFQNMQMYVATTLAAPQQQAPQKKHAPQQHQAPLQQQPLLSPGIQSMGQSPELNWGNPPPSANLQYLPPVGAPATVGRALRTTMRRTSGQ